MTTQQLKHRLISADATEQEADFLAEIWHEDFFELAATKPSIAFLGALSERITDWRSERRDFADVIRNDRQSRITAGYSGASVSAPVILNGVEF